MESAQKYKILGMSAKKFLVFDDLDIKKFIFEKKDCHIQNQHQKLSRMTYISLETGFRQNCTPTPLQFFSW